jgi:hypothetical protein
VQFAVDPGWSHERLWLYPIFENDWIVLTPGGHVYGEADANYSYLHLFEHKHYDYPSDRELGTIVQFESLVDTDDLKAYIGEAVLEAELERTRQPNRAVPLAPVTAVTWSGDVLDLPAPGIVGRLQHRLRRKTALKRIGPLGGLPPERAGGAVVETMPDAALSAKPDLSAGEGWLWLSSEAGKSFGKEVFLEEGDEVSKDRVWAFRYRDGVAEPVTRVRAVDVSSWQDARVQGFAKKTMREQLPDLDGLSPAFKLDGPAEREQAERVDGQTPEDVRTLWVDYDSQGERNKDWREVVNESRVNRYRDNPLDGPPCCLSVCKHMLRVGGDPRQWLSAWIREKKLDSGDRVCHELRTLIEVLYLGGVYDQLNVGSVLCLEAASRRVQAIVEAYSVSSVKPQWSLAKYFTGEINAEDGLCKELRSHATKLAKEEYDLQAARTKSRGVPGSSADGDGGGASYNEGAPKGDTKGRGSGGRGRGKLLAAAEEQ